MPLSQLVEATVGKKSGDAPRKKPGPKPRATGRGINVRIDADLVTKLKYLAAQKGENLSTFLSRMIRDEVDALFRAAAPRIEEKKDD